VVDQDADGWEYRVLELRGGPSAWEQTLSELGAQGWEAFTAFMGRGGVVARPFVMLKRPMRVARAGPERPA
jgi:hypothetical protein